MSNENAACPSCDRDLSYPGKPGHECYTYAERAKRIAAETPAPRGLEEVLAAHSCRDTYARVITCRCGKAFGNRFGAGDAAHRAHLAAEVRAWLVSEAVVGAAARALCAHRRVAILGADSTGGSIYEDYSRAALAAAAEVGER